MKILILKPSSLGDVIQALPVLRLLKLYLPTSEIHWWIDAGLAPLLAGDPDLAGLVRFERKRWAKPRHWPEMLRSIRWLRRQKFDLVIDLQGLARSGAFAWLTNGKFLIGLNEIREGARGLYDVAVPRASFHTHAVDWYLAVLKHLDVPVHQDFAWLPERPEIAADVKRKWLADAKLPAGSNPQWITLQPGARWDNKRWPAAHFAELVRQTAAQFPRTLFAILGSADERPLAEIIGRAAPDRCLNLCGQTSLPEMIEWVRLGELMVTNDTGPMHVAAALGKPMVALFGPTEPRRTGPYGRLGSVLRIDLPCSPCLSSRCTYAKPDECLKAVSPAMVFARVKRHLDSHS